MAEIQKPTMTHWAIAVAVCFASLAQGVDISVDVYKTKTANVVSDKFISFSVDPSMLMQAKNTYQVECSCKGSSLAPAYMRIHGLSGKRIVMENSWSQDASVKTARLDSGATIKESTVSNFLKWVKMARLTPVFVLDNSDKLSNGNWNPNSTLNLLTLVERSGIEESVVEFVDDCKSTARDHYENDLKILKSILNAHSSSKQGTWKIASGDMTECLDDDDKRNSLVSFLSESKDMLDAAVANLDDTQGLLESSSGKYDPKLKAAIGGLEMWKVYPVDSDDAFSWLKSIGEMAKSGYSVVFKSLQSGHIDALNMSYYISLLHKKFAGPKVLKLTYKPIAHDGVSVFGNCASLPSGPIAGGVTLYAVNQGESSAELSFNVAMKEQGEILQFVLQKVNKKIFVNGKQMMSKGDIQPNVHNTDAFTLLTVTLPPRSVGFWIIPNTDVSVCSEDEEPTETRQKRSIERAMTIIDQMSDGIRKLENIGDDMKRTIRSIDEIVGSEHFDDSYQEDDDVEEEEEEEKKRPVENPVNETAKVENESEPKINIDQQQTPSQENAKLLPYPSKVTRISLSDIGNDGKTSSLKSKLGALTPNIKMPELKAVGGASSKNVRPLSELVGNNAAPATLQRLRISDISLPSLPRSLSNGDDVSSPSDVIESLKSKLGNRDTLGASSEGKPPSIALPEINVPRLNLGNVTNAGFSPSSARSALESLSKSLDGLIRNGSATVSKIPVPDIKIELPSRSRNVDGESNILSTSELMESLKSKLGSRDTTAESSQRRVPSVALPEIKIAPLNLETSAPPVGALGSLVKPSNPRPIVDVPGIKIELPGRLRSANDDDAPPLNPQNIIESLKIKLRDQTGASSDQLPSVVLPEINTVPLNSGASLSRSALESLSNPLNELIADRNAATKQLQVPDIKIDLPSRDLNVEANVGGLRTASSKNVLEAIAKPFNNLIENTSAAMQRIQIPEFNLPASARGAPLRPSPLRDLLQNFRRTTNEGIGSISSPLNPRPSLLSRVRSAGNNRDLGALSSRNLQVAIARPKIGNLQTLNNASPIGSESINVPSIVEIDPMSPSESRDSAIFSAPQPHIRPLSVVKKHDFKTDELRKRLRARLSDAHPRGGLLNLKLPHALSKRDAVQTTNKIHTHVDPAKESVVENLIHIRKEHLTLDDLKDGINKLNDNNGTFDNIARNVSDFFDTMKSSVQELWKNITS